MDDKDFGNYSSMLGEVRNIFIKNKLTQGDALTFLVTMISHYVAEDFYDERFIKFTLSTIEENIHLIRKDIEVREHLNTTKEKEKEKEKRQKINDRSGKSGTDLG